MAEFNLRITAANVRKEKYDEIQPVGAVISGFSDRLIRRKWVEMVCDLWRPALTYKGKRLKSKREATTANFIQNCGWTPERCKTIADLWTEKLWLRWMETEQNGPDADTAKAQLWTGDIASASGWVAAVGKEPRGVEDAVNCFAWSLDNLKHFYVVPAAGLTTTEAESLGGKKLDVVAFREVVMPRHVIDWNSLGLSESEKANIRNPEVVVYPRFDRKIEKKDIKAGKADAQSIREALGR